MVYRYNIWGIIDVVERQKASRKFNVTLQFRVLRSGKGALRLFILPGDCKAREIRKPGISEIKGLRNFWGIGFCKLKKIGVVCQSYFDG